MNGITSPFHPVFMASTGHLRLYSHNVAAVVMGRGRAGAGGGGGTNTKLLCGL